MENSHNFWNFNKWLSEATTTLLLERILSRFQVLFVEFKLKMTFIQRHTSTFSLLDDSRHGLSTDIGSMLKETSWIHWASFSVPPLYALKSMVKALNMICIYTRPLWEDQPVSENTSWIVFSHTTGSMQHLLSITSEQNLIVEEEWVHPDH